jgi:N-acetylglutamate synthase-like GNAT family acetyltransferase
MYLVHVHLGPHPDGRRLPGTATTAALAGCAAAAAGAGRLEHVSVHADAPAHPVVGVYLRAASLEAAEGAAEALWRCAAASHPWLEDWEFRCAEVPLLPDPAAGRPGWTE